MKILLNSFLFIMAICCYSKEKQNDYDYKSLNISDSTYFSFSSSCNIQLTILNRKNSILSINGKTKKGIICENRYSKFFF
ncbi:hypothetical protein BSF41_24820 [Flavobacterium sp. ACN2]|nr:hypothetical protein BSF41_24820 [Flavobacterium sp. ACN2]